MTIRSLLTSLSAVVALIIPSTLMSQTKQTHPDFAFPAKVEKDASARLDASLSARNEPAMLRALIDLTLAGSVVSPDTLLPSYRRIDSIASHTSPGAALSMLRLLQATLLCNAYQAERWKYNSRTVPLLPIPEDYTEWSAEQFRYMTDSLCTLAVRNPDLLKSTPIATMKGIISQSRASATICPTMLDFVANRCIDIRKSMLPEEYLPVSMLSSPNAGAELKTTRPSTAAILSLYSLISSSNSKGGIPYVCNEASRINFLTSRVYPSSYQAARQEREAQLRNLYLSCTSTPAAPYALYELTQAIGNPNPTDSNTTIWLAGELRRVIATNPSFSAINCLKNTLSEIEQGEIDLTAPASVVPGTEFDIKITSRNLSSVKLTLYRINTSPFSTDSYYRHKQGAPLPEVIASRAVAFSGKIPFQTDTTVRFSLPSPGTYIIVPSIAPGSKLGDRSYRIISGTRIALATMTFTERNAIVVDQTTGRPIEAASLSLLPTVRNAALRTLASTDADGMATLASDLQGYLFASKGTDRYALPQYVYKLSDTRHSSGRTISAFTDLPLYHPGDSVEWVAIAYSFSGKTRQTIDGARLKAVMHDANGQSIDTVFASTDAFGRVAGRFAIPDGGLTGQFSIRFSEEVEESHSANSLNGSVYFTVSDYKLPTFRVEIPEVEQGVPTGGLTLRGKAMTYAGMPVTGGKVSVTVRSMPFFGRFYSGGQPFYSTETITSDDGSFTIPLSAGVLALSPDPKGVFSAEVSVTSAAQETQKSSRTFALGKRYVISAFPAADIDVSSPVDLHVTLTNPEGKDIPATLDYRLQNPAGHISHTGTVTTPSGRIDLSNVKSGIYSISLSYPDADTLTIDNIALYRLSDSLPPRDMPVWVPKTSYAGSSATIIYGTTAPSTFVLATVWDDSHIISRRWIECTPGIHTFDLATERGQENVKLNLFATRDYRTSSADITLTNPEAIPGIIVESSTFRDRLVPGSPESWTLTVRAKDGSPASAALVLDVYNQALRQLAVADWNLSPRSGSMPYLNLNQPSVGEQIYAGVQQPVRYLNCNGLPEPSLETYGLSFGPNGRFGVRNMLTSRSAGIKMMKTEAKMDMEDAVMEESVNVAYGMAAPIMAADSGAAVATESSEAESGEDTPPDSPAYRSGEIPLALFRPLLTTDADGNAVCTFTVPDANTTWSFNAIAFTRDMLTSSFATEVTASKTVMVTPNPPRFLRTGDKLRLDATVFNNSDSTFTASTIIEIFDPASGQILGSDTSSRGISPSASAIVSIELTAPEEAPFVGYRVRSEAAGSSDGEQLIIPVLPASAPVIESKPFYLAPQELTFQTSLPPKEIDSSITLTFCDNPLWYVVTALPGLRTPVCNTSVDAAASLFSTSVASGLLKKQPLLADAIKEWNSAADKDSILTSLLGRNEDMKRMLLEATPWMTDARSDSERMARLALLFDRKEIESATRSSLSLLAGLDQPDGGWSWSAGSNNWSEWSTLTVLYTLGRLNALGMLPDDSSLTAMALRAFRRFESAEAARLSKNPNGSFLEFARLTALWPQFNLTSEGAKVKAAGINDILRNWKNLSVRDKAIAAMILHRSNYRSVAATIMESVGEFATYTPQRGMWWPSVNDSFGYNEALTTAATAARAYAMVSPGAPEIDRIRQWLIIQKEAMEWGNGPVATDVVAAVLTSSPEWIASAGQTRVNVDGKPIAVKSCDRFTGELRADLSTAPSDATLILTRTGSTPAWGAVISRSTRTMRYVKAAGCTDVTIEKRFLVADGTGWRQADTLRTGDKVRVELLIKSTRTMDYVTVTDDRAACLEPVEQLPGYIFSDGTAFYRENRDAQTNLFIDRLPAGTYLLTYDMWVNNSGEFASGIATVQSQLAPALTAHSSGTTLLSR